MATTEKRVVSFLVETAAGTDENFYSPAPGVGGEWKLTGAALMPNATTAADATDYVTATLKQGATAIVTGLASTTAFTAGTERAFALLDTAAAVAAQEFGGSTDYALLNVANATTTGAALNATLSLEFEQVS